MNAFTTGKYAVYQTRAQEFGCERFDCVEVNRAGNVRSAGFDIVTADPRGDNRGDPRIQLEDHATTTR
jgi:hypothetical protein